MNFSITTLAALVAFCVGQTASASENASELPATEISAGKNTPEMTMAPLTSVVVTQCNLLVAVYVTLPDGRLLRFDKSSTVPATQLLDMAYTATRSERVEVSCHDEGSVGYESHSPV